MGIPYPWEILGPPLMTIWEACGETIILPLLSWSFVGLMVFGVGLIVTGVYLLIKYGMNHGIPSPNPAKEGACRGRYPSKN